MACPAALLLLAYALINGVPFFYPDAFVYAHYGESGWRMIGRAIAELWPAGQSALDIQTADLASSGRVSGTLAGSVQKEGWTPEAGRSVYYGLLLAIPGIFPSPWNGVILQAYCSALTVAFAWRLVMGTIGAGYLAAMAGLGLFSTFGIFASTAMPDVWSAIAILAVAVLIAGNGRLRRLDALFLWGFILFATLAHSSHLAVVAALTALCIAGRIVGLGVIPWATIGKLAVLIVATVSLGTGARMAMERAAGNPTLGIPFLTAHLVDGGPGMAFIREACPAAGYAVCEKADDLPVEWRTFIFGFSRPSEYRRQLAEEDLSFAIATLRHDPAGVLQLALQDGLRQIGMIDLATTPIRSSISESAAAEKSEVSLARKIREGRLYNASWLYRDVSLINAALVLAGLAAIILAATRPVPGRESAGLRQLLSVTLTGVLLNAVICGVLASPYDRFQARVAWLIPVIAVIAIAAFLQNRRLHLRERETTYS
ncbi:hypothetical protein [Falsirhodobacter deserti]|uniref:hypothetical protein n=1 Tax=Falsirhodobacter deserti TaxID=1365611 RepID=UPI0019D48AAE|nr:hypothetical protein [Falsirhodobacter deserti]